MNKIQTAVVHRWQEAKVKSKEGHMKRSIRNGRGINTTLFPAYVPLFMTMNNDLQAYVFSKSGGASQLQKQQDPPLTLVRA